MRLNLSWTAAIGMRAAKPFKPVRMADIVSVFDYATLQIRVILMIGTWHIKPISPGILEHPGASGTWHADAINLKQ